jgi:2'-5' RNA ligase
MGFNPNGGPPVPSEERLNNFALVIYIPGRLGHFLDDLRRELVPHYNPHAHVSVLPPRSLGVEWHLAAEQVRAAVECFSPFDIELTTLRIFPVTDVLYLEIGVGAGDLIRMHGAMNKGALKFREPFPYHPHVTLAQEVAHSDVEPLNEIAQHRWTEYAGPRSFLAERAVFVQNTLDNRWLDLAAYVLGAVPVG